MWFSQRPTPSFPIMRPWDIRLKLRQSGARTTRDPGLHRIISLIANLKIGHAKGQKGIRAIIILSIPDSKPTSLNRKPNMLRLKWTSTGVMGNGKHVFLVFNPKTIDIATQKLWGYTNMIISWTCCVHDGRIWPGHPKAAGAVKSKALASKHVSMEVPRSPTLVLRRCCDWIKRGVLCLWESRFTPPPAIPMYLRSETSLIAFETSPRPEKISTKSRSLANSQNLNMNHGTCYHQYKKYWRHASQE